VAGNLAYVADGEAGLQVVRLSGGPGFLPGFLVEPADQVALLGGTVTFHAQAAGDEPLQYQWRKDGLNLADSARITGSGSATLQLASIQAEDLGAYDVVVSNQAGSVTSHAARLRLASELTVVMRSGEVILSWGGGGTLEQAPTVRGPWTDAAISSPFSTAPSGPMQYYRVRW